MSAICRSANATPDRQPKPSSHRSRAAEPRKGKFRASLPSASASRRRFDRARNTDVFRVQSCTFTCSTANGDRSAVAETKVANLGLPFTAFFCRAISLRSDRLARRRLHSAPARRRQVLRRCDPVAFGRCHRLSKACLMYSGVASKNRAIGKSWSGRQPNTGVPMTFLSCRGSTSLARYFSANNAVVTRLRALDPARVPRPYVGERANSLVADRCPR
jgi:hypothetical protein